MMSSQVRHASVIICTRNRAELLPQIIHRLRVQDYPSNAFEIVVVDNGSTDDTPGTIERLMDEMGAPLRYVVETRSGVSYARNRGAEAATYPYLVYLDDDCSVEADWLAHLLSGFDLHPDVLAVGGRVVLDWSYVGKPAWIGPGLERWLGANGHLGSQPRLLDAKVQVMESNMAVTHEAWRQGGGFLGMEQFGSRHMAAGEVLYLLHNLRRQGGQVAFVPQASVLHRMGSYSRRRFLERGYWQGVSAGMLDYLVHQRTNLWGIRQALVDAVGGLVLLLYCGLSYLALDGEGGMLYFVRAVRRFSLTLTEMRLLGDWESARTWHGQHPAVVDSPAAHQIGFEK